MVIRRGRIEVFGPVLTELQDLYRRHVGQFAGTVVSAVPLADDQKATLLKSLSKATGHQLEIHWIVDPSVLGGLRFLSGDTLIDTTLAHKLDRLRTELRGAQVV
jgi:F-type H+-transporting ATPase subunit delta